jgi:hypothetical protein
MTANDDPKLLGQRGEDRLAIAGVFAPLLLVEADNVATILDFDFFELQRARILGPFALGGDFDPGRIAFEHHLGDLFGAAHAHPDDVMDGGSIRPRAERVASLTMPRSATTQSPRTRNFARMRSMTGSSVLASVVLPSHIQSRSGGLRHRHY